MKKISTLVVGLSLLASSALVAQSMQMSGMNHGQMANQEMSQGNMGAYHNQMMSGAYMVSMNSMKPMVSGVNHMIIVLKKDTNIVTNAKVRVKFFMPAMPGMAAMEYKTNAKLVGNRFECDVPLSMGGTWQYHLEFKTSDGEVHKTRGSVNI